MPQSGMRSAKQNQACSAWLAHRFSDVAQARNGLASIFYTLAYVNLLAF
jgi:hypothetical protein